MKFQVIAAAMSLAVLVPGCASSPPPPKKPTMGLAAAKQVDRDLVAARERLRQGKLNELDRWNAELDWRLLQLRNRYRY